MCQSQDLTKEPIWKGVARRLGEWHAILPVRPTETTTSLGIEADDLEYLVSVGSPKVPLDRINAITPNKPTPNIWTVIQKWIFALPVRTEVEVERKSRLQQELERTVAELGNNPGLGKDGVCFPIFCIPEPYANPLDCCWPLRPPLWQCHYSPVSANCRRCCRNCFLH